MISILKKYIRFLKKQISNIIYRHSSLYQETFIMSALLRQYKKDRQKKVFETDKNIDLINANKNGNKIKIVFICQVPSIWNASKSIFISALNRMDVETHLIAIPEKKMGDYSVEEYGFNEAYEYCKTFFPETVNGYDYENKKWFDLRKLSPDYVILNRPYDVLLPPEYRSNVLSQYCKVCLVPYTYCESVWTSRCAYSMDFVDSTFAVFTENEAHRDDLRNVYYKFFKCKNKHFESLGYPRFDLHYLVQPLKKEFKKLVFWLPRWTTNDVVEASTFFKYKGTLIDFFKENPSYQLIFRPHPLMFRNFIASGEMTENEEKEFRTLLKETPNFLLDESADYLPYLKAADAIISDWSSLLVEEIATGNPIIYCGKDHGWDKEAKERSALMYKAENEEDLIRLLKVLLNENDALENARKTYILNKMKGDGKAGERIIDFIIKDYTSSQVHV